MKYSDQWKNITAQNNSLDMAIDDWRIMGLANQRDMMLTDGTYISGVYYGITIAIVSLATAMTVMTLNIHHKGLSDREVPSLVKKVCFRFLAKVLCLNFSPSKKRIPVI